MFPLIPSAYTAYIYHYPVDIMIFYMVKIAFGLSQDSNYFHFESKTGKRLQSWTISFAITNTLKFIITKNYGKIPLDSAKKLSNRSHARLIANVILV